MHGARAAALALISAHFGLRRRTLEAALKQKAAQLQRNRNHKRSLLSDLDRRSLRLNLRPVLRLILNLRVLRPDLCLDLHVHNLRLSPESCLCPETAFQALDFLGEAAVRSPPETLTPQLTPAAEPAALLSPASPDPLQLQPLQQQPQVCVRAAFSLTHELVGVRCRYSSHLC